MPISLKFAFRQLMKTPGVTVTALATLAICLAANLTIFAVVDAVVIKSLPFPEGDRLVTLFNVYPLAGVPRSSASTPNYYDRRRALKSYTSISILQDSASSVGSTDGGPAIRVPTANVSPEFFATLGVKLLMGKPFTDDQLTYGADGVAILTAEYWRAHFNADPNVLGKTFLNDGQAVTVIGVLPAGFRYLSSKAEFFRPAAHDRNDETPKNRHSNNWEMIARLAPGVTLAQAQAEMDAFNAVQLRDDPYAQLIKTAGYRTLVAGLHADHVREVRPMLLLLQCGVASLLLIGAVNLANLFLIRANSRTKELAVRQALGARRGHIALDVLTETTVLAAAGGVLGVIFGALGIRVIHLLGTDTLPLGSTIAFDARVAGAAVLAALLLGVLLALPPIWLSLRTRLASGLAAESRSGTSSHGAQRMRHAFIIVQVALAFVLLSGAGLLTVSLKRLLETPPGFVTGSLYAGNIALPWNSYRTTAPRRAFVDRLIPAIEALPGVNHAAITTNLPFGGNNNDSAVTVEGEASSSTQSIRAHYISAVTPAYWATMNIPLVRGRLLRADDAKNPTVTCVVDEAFANRYWPGQDPLGKRLEQNAVYEPGKGISVVGVVRSVKQTELAEPDGHGAVYFGFPDEDMNTMYFSLVVSSPLPAEVLAPMVSKAIQQIDPGLPLISFRSMDARIDETLVARRSPAVLAGIFAAVALLLATIGTYGVLSYAVAQRQREIGVRMALGALPSQVRNQFLSLGIRLVSAGMVIGIAGAWLAGRAMQSILFNVPAVQGATLVITILVMAVVALAACLLPAARAARVDPVVALRGD
jgi:predicted permease